MSGLLVWLNAHTHGQTVTGEYIPISLDIEKTLEPFAPAGVSWSNARFAARYLITQLNRDIVPNGARAVRKKLDGDVEAAGRDATSRALQSRLNYE
jgi:hypothetical protein